MNAFAKIAAFAVPLSLAVTAADAQSLSFWTMEEQPERLARQEAMAEAFTEKTGIAVEIIPVSESDLGTRATAAFAADDLPDVIYFSLQYMQPWAEAGILDIDANTEAVEDLGEDTFAPGALEMADIDGDYAAVPLDGWTQMLIYRKDLFEEAGLEPPTTYAAITAAAEALNNPPDMYGFVAATKIDEDFMSQVLEHVLLANGATPLTEDGIGFDPAALKESLEFYKSIADTSPDGELYWAQSRELYFAGRAAMIIWSPFILDELAGLRDSAPPTINDDPTSTELAQKSGIVTTLSGPSNPDGASYASINYLGVTTSADDADAAIDFIKFSLGEGYGETLAIAPEGKFPVRRGTEDEPEKFTDLWATLPVGVDRQAPLSDLYPADVVETIVTGLDTAQRWGVEEGRLAEASRIVTSQVINQIVRRYIDDEISVDQAVEEINAQISNL
ncbi:ABC transporter substrate-binding protein [Acuticoccus yangtzensis]|uniref:ABC transporter substrate-binding protein n=1 Tax=Acuticoccus yangtzensis TaxID=1443441 RepID=UPI0009498FB6|nr:extracellular solute-binding protein [Acuticoccus yangtzensis]